MFDLLVNRLAEKECITEQLKSQNQMDWVQRMSNIRNAAEEIILSGMIFEIIKRGISIYAFMLDSSFIILKTLLR